MVENREKFNNSEKEIFIASLQILKQRAGIKGMVFDLDGSLIDDQEMEKHRNNAKEILFANLEGNNPHSRQAVFDAFEELNTKALAEIDNSPMRWNWVLDSIQKRFGKIKPHGELAFFISISKIYSAQTPVFEKALNILQWSKEADLKLAINSLSFHSWGSRKLKETQIERFIDAAQFLRCGPKDIVSWKNVAGLIECEPSKLIAVGDRVNDDAIASRLAGYKYSVLIHSDQKLKALLDRNSNVLNGIETIGHINMFPGLIQKLASNGPLL